jgi:putative flippase GtrA
MRNAIDEDIPKAEGVFGEIRKHGLHRYALASGVNTVIGILLIAALYHATGSAHVTIILSAMLGYLYSLLSYNHIAFKSRERRLPYVRYAVVYASALTLNALITQAVMLSSKSFLTAQIIAIPTVIILQWMASRFWVFRSRHYR